MAFEIEHVMLAVVEAKLKGIPKRAINKSITKAKSTVSTYRNFFKAADDAPESEAYEVSNGANVVDCWFFFAVANCQ